MAVGAGFWLLVAAVMVLLAGRARAVEGDLVWGQFRGKLLFSDVMLAPASAFPSESLRAASLRRLERSTIEGRGGFWRMHGQAFLDPVPTGGKLRLRAMDASEGDQKRDIRVFEVDIQPGQRDLPLADLVLTDAMGFVAGHRYEIVVERGGPGGGDGTPDEGKRDVYAKGVITLR
jgi:hypothetical protein